MIFISQICSREDVLTYENGVNHIEYLRFETQDVVACVLIALDGQKIVGLLNVTAPALPGLSNLHLSPWYLYIDNIELRSEVMKELYIAFIRWAFEQGNISGGIFLPVECM